MTTEEITEHWVVFQQFDLEYTVVRWAKLSVIETGFFIFQYSTIDGSFSCLKQVWCALTKSYALRRCHLPSRFADHSQGLMIFRSSVLLYVYYFSCKR